LGHVQILAIIAIVISAITAFSVVASAEEEQKEVTEKDVLQKCLDEIPDDLTYAEKTIAREKCNSMSRQWDYEHPDIQDTDNQFIRYCDDNYEVYETVGENNFLKMSTHPYGRQCVIIYKDPIWSYEGDDRVDVLIEWHANAVKESLEEESENLERNTKDAQIRQFDLLSGGVMEDRIADLQDRNDFLESQIHEKDEQLAKKDALLMEQLRVIENLASMIKKTIFEPFLNYFSVV